MEFLFIGPSGIATLSSTMVELIYSLTFPEGNLRTVPVLPVQQDERPVEEYGFHCAVLVYFLQE